ncbi:cathepsin S-like [Macrosteles quadrilineatus]|uniref:cathepsin S-like n=1 Tax=Macrosteles quadrilineatus TaxID=74068 RepID=UPI0023E17F56|nr:cathepsin S-like [Macrosteles quadrilineatus]
MPTLTVTPHNSNTNVESLEGQNYLKTKKLVSLSAGNVLYCSNFDIENGACLYGGDNLAGFKYMKKVGGIDTDACSPYDPDHGQCTYNATNKAATLSDYEQVYGDEIDLREAVAKIGPVSVSIEGNQRSYYLYKSANRLRKDAFSDRLLLETCQWFKTRVGNK